MKLKIYILLFYLFALFSTAYTQEQTANFDANIGYEHTLTSGSAINSEMVIDYTPKRWAQLYGGIKVSTKNINQAMLKGDFKWWMNDSKFIALRSQNVYSIYANDNTQSLSIGVAAIYDQEYFSIALGGNYQMYTSIFNKNDNKKSFLWEPGITYDINARIFPKSHIWNIGGEVTNCRNFVIERVYNPSFLLNGHYTFSAENTNHLKVYSQVGFQPIGITHIAVNYYSLIINIGVICEL